MEYPKIETLYERDESFAVKVGQYKNRTYTLIKTWEWTEKIDGTNIRIVWTPSSGGIDNFEPHKVAVLGRTDNAQIPADLVNYLHQLIPAEKFVASFQTSVVLYGEGYGAGIQKGGDLSPTKKFILFDVLVDGKWWLNQEAVNDVGQKLGIDVVPIFGTMTIEEATEFVRQGFRSKLNGGKARAEGLVGRTAEPLFDKKGARLIVKLKTKDFGAERRSEARIGLSGCGGGITDDTAAVEEALQKAKEQSNVG